MARLDPALLAQLNSWYAPWRGIRACVLGLGVAGFAAADVLAELGVTTRVFAQRGDVEKEKILSVLDVTSCIGDNEAQLAALREFDPQLIIVSPGYRPYNPLLLWAAQAGITVWGDIEFAWRVRDKVYTAEWLCITGTNGKTTTAQLTATMLVSSGAKAAPVGNIGVPVLDAIRDPEGFDALVVELSSFQLHWLDTVRPYASCVLNIARDHLDWHGSYEAYIAAKAKIFERTKTACVYNRHEEIIETLLMQADVQEGARAVGFGLDTPARSELGVVEGILVDRGYHAARGTTALELVTLSELHEAGLAQPHTVANVLAAAALARAYGVAPTDIKRAVLGFVPDKHRVEPVAKQNGVLWVDDSKATNSHAADAALSAVASTVWIMGGDFKGTDIVPLLTKHVKKLRAVVVIGANSQETAGLVRRVCPELTVAQVAAEDAEGAKLTGDAVMERAVVSAANYALAGDTVLLAPAAASIDQFGGYAERGLAFARAVQQLLGVPGEQ
ncbi:UDP-N-acetylmuramoyl-L-alanine--D-glutamate ligase [Canibacter sp. lx-45]|uniref:UDP-N-acetylmuramoyl-L-alanine--D-glutamate ligase n=1 Tax=Canibacter zhuwentaonis TaxID=2837491 RepID=UPI001BDC1BE9|nr:UDP-N-acetylmuramoyl-L-alanine--D-glutamate ligase [Canibacter zhuwentaonis]MBT1035256.1 UDP-N-acetylmuramoyl-L-alanine--D-glutamate ligase [Canibacter zhuwentaonis]